PLTPQPPHHSRAPLVAAVGIWAVTLILGSGFGLYAPKHAAPEAAELHEVTSDWRVEEGTIAINVQQFGSTVTGSFADWTADITFDPNKIDGKAGHVEVIIAIGSLTLGSVTDQAMGPDFFDQASFPTAKFSADINANIDGYEANGTLTIKDITFPISMPFRLSAQGSAANMQAHLTLQRLDFGIGANMPDESSLAFAVDVNVALSATTLE
ncbi:MAG: YceI family protein, partial [Sulfitobacter sp.]